MGTQARWVVELFEGVASKLMVKRLGYYLFTRAKRRGDKRFDKYETNWWGMTVPFVLQIIWVYVMLLPTLILNEFDNPEVEICSYIGYVFDFKY